VNDDGDVIRIVERGGAAVESSIVEIPFRRGELPNQPREIVPVFGETFAAAFGGKVKLIPPLQFGLGWQRHLASFLAADQRTMP